MNYYVRLLSLAAIFAALTGSVSGAFAQQSSQTGVASAIVGSAYLGSITDLQNQVLDNAIHQGAPGGVGSDRSRPSAADALPGEFPTGRLRETWHDGYKSLSANHDDTFSSRTSEASVFGSAFIKAPGAFLGGQLQLGAFAGYDKLNIAYGSTPQGISPVPGTKSRNESFLFGAYGLYTAGVNYAMLTAAGAEGTTDQSGGGFFGSYGTHGAIVSLVGGHVLDVDHSGLKLDLRSGVSYVDFSGDSFLVVGSAQRLQPGLSVWTGSLSATLFSEVALSGDATLRPYIKAEIRDQLSYQNTLLDIGVDTYKFSQADTTGVAELGFDYAIPGVTFNAAVYGETASDRSTVGGKLGAKFKLN